jgi:hypothetical protein
VPGALGPKGGLCCDTVGTAYWIRDLEAEGRAGARGSLASIRGTLRPCSGSPKNEVLGGLKRGALARAKKDRIAGAARGVGLRERKG